MQEDSTQFHDAMAENNADKFSKALLNINALTWLTQKYKNLTPVELLLKKIDKPTPELQQMFDALVTFIQQSLPKYFPDDYPSLLSLLNTLGRDRIIPVLHSSLYITFSNIVEKEKIALKTLYPQIYYAMLDLKRKHDPKKIHTKTFVSGESFSHLEPALKEAAKKKDVVALKKLLKDIRGKILWIGSHGQSLAFIFRHLRDVREFLLDNGAQVTLRDLELIARYDRDPALLKTFAARYNKTRAAEEHYVVGDIEFSSEHESSDGKDEKGVVEEIIEDDLDGWVVVPGNS